MGSKNFSRGGIREGYICLCGVNGYGGGVELKRVREGHSGSGVEWVQVGLQDAG